MQEAEIRLRHHGAPVHADAAHFERGPHGVARKELVIGRNARELHHAEFENQVVDQFLRFAFGERSFAQIAFDVNVEERRNASHAHRGAVLRLHRGQVPEIEPLHGFPCVFRRCGNIKSVGRRHRLHRHEGADLIGDFFPLTNDVFGHDAAAAVEMIGLFLRDEEVNPVQRHTAVVADDAAAAVRVGQTRDDLIFAHGPHLGGIRVVHSLIVSLTVFVEDLIPFRIRRVAVSRAGFFGHANAAVGHEGAL